MRITKILIPISGAIVLATVFSFLVERNLPNPGLQAGETNALCITLDRALPAGHPSLEKAQYSDSLTCDKNIFPLDTDMKTGQSYSVLARHLQEPQAPVFEHVSLTDEDGSPISVLGKCVDCHGANQVLSDDHVPTADMPMAQCRACHAPQTELSLRGEMPLDHVHGLSGVGCTSCHIGDEAQMTEPPMEVCLACHGSLEDLAAATADVKPTNPHSSPHGAPYTECSLCHMQHEPSQDFCATCHDFEFKLP